MKAETKKQEPGTIRRRSSYNRSLRKDNRQLFSMCVPGIILLALFAYLPMFGLVLAFKNYKFNLGIFGSEWVGFKNFEFFFTSGTFGRLIRNTLGLNLLFLLCNTVITVLLALLLYEINSRHAIKAFQTVIFLPFIVSWVAASYALYANLADVNGIVNGILTFFGKETVSWYTTPKWWPYILLVCYLWKNMGYGSVVYLAAITGIDAEIYEAAQIDGATILQRIFRITLPNLLPTIITVTLLNVGSIFRGNFALFWNLVGNNSLLYKTTDVIDTYVYRSMLKGTDYGMTGAAGMLQSVLCFGMIMAVNAIVKKINAESALF